MAIKKMYYNGKCIMTVDMDYIQDDSMYEYLHEILGNFKDRAMVEFDIENKFEDEAKKVWKGKENWYELLLQVEKEVEGEGFEKIDQVLSRIKEKLNDEEYKLFKELRNEYVTCYNNLENDFYAGTGCLDYVWVEHNGEKRGSFLW